MLINLLAIPRCRLCIALFIIALVRYMPVATINKHGVTINIMFFATLLTIPLGRLWISLFIITLGRYMSVATIIVALFGPDSDAAWRLLNV